MSRDGVLPWKTCLWLPQEIMIILLLYIAKGCETRGNVARSLVICAVSFSARIDNKYVTIIFFF